MMFGTQNPLNYMKRKATQILSPVGFCVFSEFCVK